MSTRSRRASSRRAASERPGLSNQASGAYGAENGLPGSKALSVAQVDDTFETAFGFEDPIDAQSSPLILRAQRNTGPGSTNGGPTVQDIDPGTTVITVKPSKASRNTSRNTAFMAVIAAAILGFWCLPNEFQPNHYVAGRSKSVVAANNALASIQDAISPLASSVMESQEPVFINYFSPATGAVVNPMLSSPSMYLFGSLSQRANWQYLADFTLLKGAESALLPFTDVGDSWCTSNLHVTQPAEPQTTWTPSIAAAAVNPFIHIKAQLAVRIGFDIYPTMVSINSPPHGALLDLSARPGAMSLWVQVRDSTARDKVWAAVLGVSPDRVSVARPPIDDPPSALSWFQSLRRYGLFSMFTSTLNPAEMALDDSWVRVGSIKHDEALSAGNRITFGLDVDLETLAVPVRHAVLRVESNMGQEYTCLYRVMMAGKLA